MKQKTMCSICKSEPISNDALLYSHSCKKEALAKRKKAPLFDEEPKEPSHCLGSASGGSLSRGNPEAVPASGGSLAEAPPPPSYREILARQQQEMRRQKAARIVNPIRAHFLGMLSLVAQEVLTDQNHMLQKAVPCTFFGYPINEKRSADASTH